MVDGINYACLVGQSVLFVRSCLCSFRFVVRGDVILFRPPKGILGEECRGRRVQDANCWLINEKIEDDFCFMS